MKNPIHHYPHYPRAWVNPRTWMNPRPGKIHVNFAFLIIFLTNCWTNPFWRPILFPEKKADNKMMWIIPFAGNSATTTSAETVTTPVFTPAAGTYSSDQSVTISTTTSGATIYYTLDNSTPTTSSTQYTNTISVAGNGTSKTIKAIAVKSGLVNSAVGSGTYTIGYDTLPSPTVSPKSGMYNNDFTLTIASPVDGATIKYSLRYGIVSQGGGGNVTQGSSPLNISMAIPASNSYIYYVLTTWLEKSGMLNSEPIALPYNIIYTQSATPDFDPIPEMYNTNQSITISSNTLGANIYYTLDGTTPSISSTLYTTPISIGGNGTVTSLKAIAIKSGMTNSSVSSGTYTINYSKVATPLIQTFYTTEYQVKLSTNTTGAKIYYTDDGTIPTTSSKVYSGLISYPANVICTTTIIKAIATKDGMVDSEIFTASIGTPCI